MGQFGSHRMKLRDAASWLPNHLDRVRRLGASLGPNLLQLLCLHDLLPDHPWVLTTDWTYVRFHGPRAPQVKYVGRYGKARLAAPATRLCDWLASGTDVYAYFNNDYDGHAVRDAVTLRRLLGAAWEHGG